MLVRLEQHDAEIEWDNKPPTSSLRNFKVKPRGGGFLYGMRMLGARRYADEGGTTTYLSLEPGDDAATCATFDALMQHWGVKPR